MPRARKSKVTDENVALALTVLEEFARELQNKCEPPTIPYDLEATARGWSMRLERIGAKIASVDRTEQLVICSRLAGVLAVLHAYMAVWEDKLRNVDPLLADYEFMPGDHNAVDSVRLLAERVNVALYEVACVLFDDLD